MTPLAVNAMGAVTAGGNNAALSVASIYTSRQHIEEVELEGVEELTGIDGGQGGHAGSAGKVIGAPALIGGELRGADRLRVLGMQALRECGAGAGAGVRGARVPLVMLAPLLEGYGRDAAWLLSRTIEDADLPLDRDASFIFAAGRGGENQALALVGRLLLSEAWPACFLLGVDSLLVASRVAREIAASRVADLRNPTGFVPGEAGTALLLSLNPEPACAAIIAGGGHCAGGPSYKTAAAVLAEAAEGALADAHVRPRTLSAVCHDGPGNWEQLEELALADGWPPLSLASHAQRFIPAISTGEVGAASGMLSLAVLSFLLMKGVLQRPALALFSSDGPARGAAVLVPAGLRVPRGVNDG